jgi:hypothetical protein
VSELHDRPSAAVLVDAVREWLDGPVLRQLDPAARFEARVASGVLRIVARELALGAGPEIEHREVLESLGVADEAELAAAIRSGRFDGRLAEVAAALRRTVSLRLAVDHPGYDAGAS